MPQDRQVNRWCQHRHGCDSDVHPSARDTTPWYSSSGTEGARPRCSRTPASAVPDSSRGRSASTSTTGTFSNAISSRSTMPGDTVITVSALRASIRSIRRPNHCSHFGKRRHTRSSSPVFVRIINQGCAADPCNDEADWQGVEVIGVYHARSNLIARPEHPKSTLGVFDKLHEECLRPAAGPKWNSNDPESKTDSSKGNPFSWSARRVTA